MRQPVDPEKAQGVGVDRPRGQRVEDVSHYRVTPLWDCSKAFLSISICLYVSEFVRK